MSKKILIFAPHGSYQVHHQLDAVIGTALKLRGCEVQVIVCDQLFKDCYIAGRPFDKSYCDHCVAGGVQLYQAFGLPIITLKSLLSDLDFRETTDWAASVDLPDFQNAQFEGLPIGQWMIYGMFALFRTSRLRFSDAEVARVARNMLQNGALIARALRRLFSQYQPDHAITYQGGHSYYRVFYEMMRARGVPVICHERGYTNDSFLLISNRSNYEMNCRYVEEWENWQDIPLRASELEELDQLLCSRERGENMNFVQFSGWETRANTIRETLRVPSNAPLLVMFGSGDWEVGMYQGYGPLNMAHKSQLDWISHSAEIARKLGMHLVVRHHPLGGGTESYPRANEFIGELIQFNRKLGDHVRTIMPFEKVSSYDLMWHAKAVVSLFSTTSVEAVARGVGSLTTCESVYQPAGVGLARSPESYEEAIRNAIARTEESSIESLRGVYRYLHFIYFVAFSQRFRSCGIKNVYERDIRIKNGSELLPGNDPALDRVCDHILHGTPLYVTPDQDRDRSGESKYLEEVRTRNAKRRIAATIPVPVRDSMHGEVTVIPLTQSGVFSLSPDFVTSCIRLRHRRAFLGGPAAIRGLPPRLALTLLQSLVAGSSSPIIWIVKDNLVFDEGALSMAVDALSSASDKHVAVSGFYVLDGGGHVREEFGTRLVKATDFAADWQRFSFLGDIGFLLSLSVWRRTALLEWFERVMRGPLSGEQVAAELYQLLFHDTRAVCLETPLLYATPDRTLSVETNGVRL